MVHEFKVTFDDETGKVDANFPLQQVVALGMLEYARELFLFRVVRPAMMPSVLGAGAPLPMGDGKPPRTFGH